MMVKGTGIFATPAEISYLKRLSDEAYGSEVRLPALSPSDLIKRMVLERCHEIAMAHGLPDIRGYYGLGENGEFVCFNYDLES